MRNFEVTVDDINYQITQRFDVEGLFHVIRDTDMHKIARLDDGTWSEIEHTALARSFDFSKMTAEIEKNL